MIYWRKNKNHSKYKVYKLLNDLIELGYENRIIIHSSIGIDSLIKGQNNNLLILRLNLENKLFELEINKDSNTFFNKEIETEKVIEEIVKFV